MKESILGIPLQTAKTYTHNWRNLIKQINSNGVANIDEVRAFNLTLAEVDFALSVDPVTGKKPTSVRLYLGCTSSNPTSVADFKLMIVGVDSNGEDMLDHIGDFSHPCPTMCDQNSPLNK